MTEQEKNSAKFKKRLEEVRNKKDMAESIKAGEEAMYRERRNALEEARNKKAPVQQTEGAPSNYNRIDELPSPIIVEG